MVVSGSGTQGRGNQKKLERYVGKESRKIKGKGEEAMEEGSRGKGREETEGKGGGRRRMKRRGR